MLAADIDAQGCHEGIVVVEPVSQGLEHRFSLTNSKTDGQYSLARPGEELPHDDAGIARAAGCIWSADDHLDR